MEFNAYVDEAGDEGCNFERGSSRWFIMSGIVVAKESDREASHVIDQVKATLQTRTSNKPLHWRDLKHRQKLAYIKTVGRQTQLKAFLVCLDKARLREDSPLKTYPRMYLYIARHLIELISWYARDYALGPNIADFIFANRSNISYDELRTYINAIQLQPGCQIAGGVVREVVPRQQAQCKLLQVADAVASSAFEAFESDRYGNVDPNYLLTAAPILYRRGADLLNFGLKLLPKEVREGVRKEFVWLDGL